MKIKQLWKGIFAFPTGLKREYAQAYTEKQARVLMIKRLAKEQGVYPSFLFDWLSKHPAKYTIKLEMEFTEED
jgi:transposase-like protein